MKAGRTAAPADADPDKRLETFISKFDRKDQQLIHAVRRAVRKWFPTVSRGNPHATDGSWRQSLLCHPGPYEQAT